MKFSIITCTYNSERYMQDNIISVKGQTFDDFEHIFIDGFSSDNTLKIIEDYKKEFPEKVKLFQLNPNGISNAMNKGIEKSSGEYLIHLHSDDSFYANNILEDVEKFIIENNSPDWIYGKANVIEENGISIGLHPKRKFLQLNHNIIFGKYLIKFLNYIPHQTVFLRKSVFDKFGKFDETIKSIMDLDLWIRITRNTKWYFFDKIICNYRIRPGAQSSDKNNILANKANLKTVQLRYLNKLEYGLAIIINYFLDKINKTRR